MSTRAVVAVGLVFVLGAAAQDPRNPRGGRPYQPNGKVKAEIDPAEQAGALSDLVQMSQLIVGGSVTSVLPAVSMDLDPDAPLAETQSMISVSSVLGGKPPGVSTIQLTQFGGKPGRWDISVPDEPLVRPGERYILFLNLDTRKEPPNTVGVPRYYIVGAWSGKVSVQEGKVHFLPRASEQLHIHDNQDVSSFIADVRAEVNHTVPRDPNLPIHPGGGRPTP